MRNKNLKALCLVALTTFLFVSCSKHNGGNESIPNNPDQAEVVKVDRFSATAGKLFVRDNANGLPAADAPINFDQGGFITKGLGPAGQKVSYYNFDIMSTTPAPIYAFYWADQSAVTGQLNVVNVIPGDQGYNDFWQVYKVTVPDNYVANTISSYDQLLSSGYTIEKTNNLVNCPVVPRGSTANLRLTNESNGLIKGWYKNKLVYYFNFGEKALMATTDGLVPLSPIYVSFNINPNLPNGGPSSGFKTETGTLQTHNVTGTIPSQQFYSPLWIVVAYDNGDFQNVSNLTTASASNILVPNAGFVNCPIEKIE